MITLNPENQEFHNESSLISEFVRQSSICHGCRRCFNYCPAFPHLFRLTDQKGPKALTLEDLKEVAEKCFHCNLCYVNCPYTPPHEFSMDFPHLMEWGLLHLRSKRGIPLRERLMEMTDAMSLLRPLGQLGHKLAEVVEDFSGVKGEAPRLKLSSKGFLGSVKPKVVENPKAKVVLFHTCLVENFYPEIGEDLVDVYNALGIEVTLAPFKCCGAPMLDVGDARGLKRNAEYNVRLLEKYREMGYEVVSPIPTCTLMLTKEYKYVLDRDVPKVYDSMEFLVKLRREKKIEVKGNLQKSALYHPPCHLRYLGVGMPGVQLMRGVKVDVDQVDRGCSGIDGGWGLRHYEEAKKVGSKMMEAFREGKADYLSPSVP